MTLMQRFHARMVTLEERPVAGQVLEQREVPAGELTCTARTSRCDPAARERGAGWTGGETVRPVRTSDPLLRGASAGSSRTRVGVSVRLTTRPGAGAAGALTMRRRAGTACPGLSGTARIGRLARSRGRTSAARARGSIGGLAAVDVLRPNPLPPPAL